MWYIRLNVICSNKRKEVNGGTTNTTTTTRAHIAQKTLFHCHPETRLIEGNALETVVQRKNHFIIMHLVGRLSTGALSPTRERGATAFSAKTILERNCICCALKANILESPKLHSDSRNFVFQLLWNPSFHFSPAVLALLSFLRNRNSIRKRLFYAIRDSRLYKLKLWSYVLIASVNEFVLSSF